MKTATKINLSVTVQVEVSAAWGDDWRVADIAKEARRTGIETLKRALAEGKRPEDHFGIIGEPQLLAILTPVS